MGDAKNMLANMKTATELARGNPDMEKIVKATRAEMNDFVAFYRRQPKVSGMPSFSTLSGHYASYGNKYPVPEKRRTRLQQQYKEIERARARKVERGRTPCVGRERDGAPPRK